MDDIIKAKDVIAILEGHNVSSHGQKDLCYWCGTFNKGLCYQIHLHGNASCSVDIFHIWVCQGCEKMYSDFPRVVYEK